MKFIVDEGARKVLDELCHVALKACGNGAYDVVNIVKMHTEGYKEPEKDFAKPQYKSVPCADKKPKG